MWDIYTDKNFDKKLDKIRSNTAVLKMYKIAVSKLARSSRPETLGDRKHGHLRLVYGYRLTKSHRLLYHVDYNKRVIILVDLDDHKNLYSAD